MHTLYKRTYPIYTNAYTYNHPQTYICIHTHIQTKLHSNSFKHIQTYAHSQANKELCTITNTDIPTNTHVLTKDY
jgi:hypothetical protein